YCLRVILQRISAAAAVGVAADSFRKGTAAFGGAQEVEEITPFHECTSKRLRFPTSNRAASELAKGYGWCPGVTAGHQDEGSARHSSRLPPETRRCKEPSL